MMLLDRLVDRATRRRALETALAAYVLLDQSFSERIGKVFLSAEAIVLLDVILNEPQMTKAALVAGVRVVLRSARHLPSGCCSLGERCQRLVAEDQVRSGDVLRLARDVTRVTVQDLSAVGTFDLVISLLASEWASAARAHAA